MIVGADVTHPSPDLTDIPSIAAVRALKILLQLFTFIVTQFFHLWFFLRLQRATILMHLCTMWKLDCNQPVKKSLKTWKI